MTAHELKIWPVYFQAVIEGRKTFEVRRNDRDFKVGDTLRLREFNPENGGSYTGREVYRAITYLSKFAQELGYVVLALSAAPAGEARLWELEAGVRKLQRELADDAMSPMFSTPEAGMLTGIASRLDALLTAAPVQAEKERRDV